MIKDLNPEILFVQEGDSHYSITRKKDGKQLNFKLLLQEDLDGPYKGSQAWHMSVLDNQYCYLDGNCVLSLYNSQRSTVVAAKFICQRMEEAFNTGHLVFCDEVTERPFQYCQYLLPSDVVALGDIVNGVRDPGEVYYDISGSNEIWKYEDGQRTLIVSRGKKNNGKESKA